MKITQLKNPPFISATFDPRRLKVISGGQNGADQAGLRAAVICGIPTGGTAPQGWITLDGQKMILLKSLGLVQADKPGYPYRTELNVKNADITLRFASNFGSTGERCTYNAINKHKKPFVDFDVPQDLTVDNAETIAEHIVLNGYYTINIAGNAEKTSPGIGKLVEDFLTLVFTYINDSNEDVESL